MPRPNRTTYAVIDRPFKEIGDRIKQFRLSKGLDQVDLLTDGVNKITISRYETGLREPSVRFLKHLRDNYGADLNWIVCGE